jgi:hypothetical protein|tara:strand:- start:2713 stop:3018 length:306 start_codon:yes stop_codon:yes gene_type:complete
MKDFPYIYQDADNNIISGELPSLGQTLEEARQFMITAFGNKFLSIASTTDYETYAVILSDGRKGHIEMDGANDGDYTGWFDGEIEWEGEFWEVFQAMAFEG